MSNSEYSSVSNPFDLSPLAMPKNEQLHLPVTPIPMFNIGIGDNSNVNASQSGGHRIGRPRGSKNRPKAEKESTMHSIALEVPSGVDLIEWVIHYAYSRKTCIVIVGGHGLISHATLSRMGSQLPPKVFTEHLTLMSFTCTYAFSRSAQGPTYFNAMLRRENGCMVYGAPQRMITMGSVVLTATLYKNPELLTVGLLKNEAQA